MVPRVPDEYFRKRAAESDDVRDDDLPRRSPETTAVKTVAPEKVRDGIAPRLMVLIMIATVALAFTVGRLVLFPPQQHPLITASPSPSPTATRTSEDQFRPYTGTVTTTVPVTAEGACVLGGDRDSPDALVDNDPGTLWRCRGDGIGEQIVFAFDTPQTLVGFRMVNGNTVWTDRYLAERRVVTVRWQFADGSYFDQGFAANDRAPQEVRFPEVVTTTVTLTLVESTDPGDPDSMANAVSISSLDFLRPA